jgi:hypothetical protein
MGMDVVPMLNRLRKGTMPGSAHPPSTPTNIAAKIQSVRYRSRKARLEEIFVFIHESLKAEQKSLECSR